MYLPLLLLSSLFSLLLVVKIVSVVREAKYLTLVVYLDSRKDWLSFNPDLYFYRMDEDDLARVRSILEPESKKNKLRLRWGYSTPAGRSQYWDEIVYTADESLRDRLDEAEATTSDGLRKVNALNNAYAKALEEGKEIDDDIPKIYCYRILGSRKHEMWVKVGYASKNAHRRIEQQFKTAARLEIEHEVLFVMPALTISGGNFKDHAVHKELKLAGVENEEGEWFSCSSSVAKSAVQAVQRHERFLLS